MAKGSAAEKKLDRWTCEPPLSDCETTVTVRLAPITHRGNSTPAKDLRRALHGLKHFASLVGPIVSLWRHLLDLGCPQGFELTV